MSRFIHGAVPYVIVILLYLAACALLAFRPTGAGSVETGSGVTFSFEGSLETALSEYAKILQEAYGENIKVNVKGTSLSYSISFPTSDGYDDVTDTITLSEDDRYGTGVCTMTYNLVIKERTVNILAAPIHYLMYCTRENESGRITHELRDKLTKAAQKRADR